MWLELPELEPELNEWLDELPELPELKLCEEEEELLELWLLLPLLLELWEE